MSFEWWQKNVIYHIYLPSFKDSNDDGIGDFLGLISKLDYFKDLKIQTLLLSPFYPSPMIDNGYDITSYVDVDPIFGSMDDFDLLMIEIKNRGMNIIIDLVLNHTSDQHEWFKKSVERKDPYVDYYVWVDAKYESDQEKPLPPNNWLSVFGGSAWMWNEQRQQFYLHQFLPEQPDLNYRNSMVKNEIKKVMEFWLEKGVDGFRIDAASHLFEDELLRDEPLAKDSKANPDEYGYLDHIYTKTLRENFDFLKELRKVLDDFSIRAGKPKIMFAEGMEKLEDIMAYYGTVGERLADFPLNFQLYKVRPTSTGAELFEIIDAWLKHMPKGKFPNWVISSHDYSRVVSRVGKNFASSLHMVVMLLPGIPFIYYGDELGMENGNISPSEVKDGFALRTVPENSRDPMRTPMQWNSEKNAGFTNCKKPWLPVNANYKTVNVEVQKRKPVSFLKNFKYLLELKVEPAIMIGTLEYPLITDTIFSLLRFLIGTKCYLLVLNMTFEPLCVDFSNTCCSSLPSEASLEISNRDLLEVRCYSENSVNHDVKEGVASVSLCTSQGSSQQQITIPLNNICLEPQEAMILSFIGNI